MQSKSEKRKAKLAALAAFLVVATAAPAGPKWFDTYSDAQKTATEFNRPMVLVLVAEKDQVKATQRMFDKPELQRFHPMFVFVYDMVILKDNTVSCPLFHKYQPDNPISKPIVLIFFASPDEKVLYKMAGEQSAKSLATAMGIALHKHGPVPSLKKLKEVKEKLDRVPALLEKKDYATAARLCSEAVEAKPTPKLIEDAQKKLATIQEAVKDQLAAALEARDAKNYAEAVPKLAALKKDFSMLELGKQAAAELEKLQKVSEAKAAFDALAKAAPGKKPSPGGPAPEAPPAAAVERPKPEEDPDAFTDAELDALDELTQGGGDQEPAARPAADHEKASRLLGLARNWIANQQPDKARPLLKQILDKYPTSTAAEHAKALLEKLD